MGISGEGGRESKREAGGEGNGIRTAGQWWNLDTFLTLDVLRQRAGLHWIFVLVFWALMEGYC